MLLSFRTMDHTEMSSPKYARIGQAQVVKTPSHCPAPGDVTNMGKNISMSATQQIVYKTSDLALMKKRYTLRVHNLNTGAKNLEIDSHSF